MKREDVIRIAKEAGAWGSHTEHAVPYYLTQFAKLVEQATLERAAKGLRELSEVNAKAAEETTSSDNETWHEHAALVYSRSAASILKLKDSND